jgi:hypothetical protein
VTDTLEEAQKLIEELDLTPMIARGMKEKRRSPPAAPLRARRGRGGGYAPRLRRPLGGPPRGPPLGPGGPRQHGGNRSTFI